MAFNRFRFGVILRVVLLALTLLLLLLLIFRTEYIMTTLIVGVALLVQVYGLVHYVEQIERDLTRFLEAVKYEDFFETFSGRRSVFAARLHDEFTRIIEDFRTVRGQREEQMLYLQTVVQHVGIALLVYDSDGEVDLINSASKRLFHVSRLRTVQQLEEFDPHLVRALLTMRPGQRVVVKTMDEGNLLQLSIYASEFRREAKRFLLVSIQDIGSELEEKELEAWQNLIRVLTHEIRNTITPIASLANTTHELLEETTGGESEEIEDARLAVGTIRNRSEGLLKFVEAFRSLYKMPKPSYSRFDICEFFEHLDTFFSHTFGEKGIEASFSCSPAHFDVTCDRDLIEQVMINLVTNAVQAVQGREDPRVRVTAQIDSRGRARISVIDNGPGIDEETVDKVFIPFFTTKPEGTGIGLSLSRQIMRMHKGSISVQSKVGEGAAFHLTF